MARDNHCLLGSKLLAPLNNLLDWLRQEPGKLLLKTKVSCGCLSHSGFSMKKADSFFAPLYLSQSALTGHNDDCLLSANRLINAFPVFQ